MNMLPSPRRDSAAPSSFSEKRGSALFLLLILSVVMASILAGIFTYINRTSQLEKRSNVRLESTYAAEYAFERAYQQLNTLVHQDNNNLPGIAATTNVTNLGTAPSNVFTTDQGYTWGSFITVPIQAGVPVSAISDFNPLQGTYKFLSVVEFTRRVPTMTAPVHVQFQREWNYVFKPLFQYAIFYDGDMELFPGKDFIVNGRVHSNGTIYLGTSASIRFDDYVSYVDGWGNRYSPLHPSFPASPGSGPVHYNDNDGDTDLDDGPKPVKTTVESPPGTTATDTSDTNYNNDGPHELIEIPNSWQLDANAEDRMYRKAGLKVLVNSVGTSPKLTADDGNEVDKNSRVFLTHDGTKIPSTDALARYLTGNDPVNPDDSDIFSTATMKDYRENSTEFTTTDIDIGKLTSAYNNGGLPSVIPNDDKWPNSNSVPQMLRGATISPSIKGKELWNGVLYVADFTNSSGHRTAVRLLNGASLPAGRGLTVATQNPAYIVGDYNTGGSPPVNNTSNSISSDNFVSGYTVQPAAVIADAVTVVSSKWITGDYNSKPTLTDRAPVSTTINCALISGIVPSNGTDYSGGVENYIRLLENWSGKRLTYYGSIVNLYQSQQSTARWRDTGNYYNAPTRNWYFDTNYRDPNKLPPGTPVLKNLARGQWVQVL